MRDRRDGSRREMNIMCRRLITTVVWATCLSSCKDESDYPSGAHAVFGLPGVREAQVIDLREGVKLAWTRGESDGICHVVVAIEGKPVSHISVFGNGYETIVDATNDAKLIANVSHDDGGRATLNMVRVGLGENGKTVVRTYDSNGDVLEVRESDR